MNCSSMALFFFVSSNKNHHTFLPFFHPLKVEKTIGITGFMGIFVWVNCFYIIKIRKRASLFFCREKRQSSPEVCTRRKFNKNKLVGKSVLCSTEVCARGKVSFVGKSVSCSPEVCERGNVSFTLPPPSLKRGSADSRCYFLI